MDDEALSAVMIGRFRGEILISSFGASIEQSKSKTSGTRKGERNKSQRLL